MPSADDASSSALSDAGTPRALPAPPPLSHADPHLQAAVFSPSAFLLSRTPGMSLSEISASLAAYAGALRAELASVVDRDFRAFVALAGALSAEKARIARLGWRDEEQEGGLRVGEVRELVARAKDDLEDVRHEVQAVMREREQVAEQQAQLSLLLSLHDSLARLEDLLHLPSSSAHEASTATASSSAVQLDIFAAPVSWDALLSDERADTSDEAASLSGSDSDEEIKVAGTGRLRPASPVRTASHAKRRASRASLSLGSEEAPLAEAASGDLPLRIARASAEAGTLRFLQSRALAQGLNVFVASHAARARRARLALRNDVRRLVRALLAREGGGLMRRQAGDETGAGHERWTHVPAPGDESGKAAYWQARREEEEQWLALAVATSVQLEQEDEGADEAEDVQTTLADVLVRPWARETIHAQALSHSAPLDPAVSALLPAPDSSDSSASPNPLRALYCRILAFAARDAQRACVIVERAGESKERETGDADADVRRTDLFVNVLWAEVGRGLMEELGGQLFVVGRPEAFHRNFSLTTSFLSAFLALAPSPRAALALQQHPAWSALLKRFQLPVYFQLRYREIVARLEPLLSLSAGVAAGGSISGTLPLVVAADATRDAFSAPWRKGVALPELVHRQWKLSLQVVSRYKSWLDAEVPQDPAARHDRRGAKGFLQQQQQQQAQAVAGESRAGSPRVPSRTGTPVSTADSEAAAAADEVAVRALTVLSADALWLQRELRAEFEARIVPALEDARSVARGEEPQTQAIVEALRETLHQATSFDSTLVPPLATRVLGVLKVRCAEPLRLVRSISMQYRGGSTASGPAARAVEASAFVPQILRPLRVFLGKGERKGDTNALTPASHLDEQTKNAWAAEVIDDVVGRYTAALHAMNLNYESLRRLKRGNQTLGLGSLFGRSSSAATAASGESAADADAQRMHAQMHADVAALERDVHDLATVGVHVDTQGPAWALLRSAAGGATGDAQQ